MKTVLLAVLAATLAAGTAHAQQPAPAAQATSGGYVVRRPPPPFYTGLGWSGAPVVQPDGSVRSATPPVVSAIIPGSPADKAGVRVGDEVVLVNGRDGREPGILRTRANNEVFALRIRRDGQLMEITFQSEPNPAHTAARN